LLDATAKELEKVRRMVMKGKLEGRDEIGVRVGKVINKYKMAKHYKLEITDKSLDWKLEQEKISAEAALDGIYVVRTSLKEHEIDTDGAVRSYKQLSAVERAFRSFKSIDLEVRPIRHRLEGRVRAHILLCMLAYYVKWHMNEAWRPLLFCDENLAAKQHRDPVAPAVRSKAASAKAQSKLLEDGATVHSFETLIQRLSAIVRNVCRTRGAVEGATFEVATSPDATQQRALNLLEEISV
jgi:transposase